MKKIVFFCGLISGAIVTSMMVGSVAQCYSNADFEGNMILGYASMLLAFSVIFVGIKVYRDKHLGGHISFGKAFLVGTYISLIASTIYVVVWLIYFYLFVPDFMEKYTAHELHKVSKAGATPAELAAKSEEMASFGKMYKNPIMVVLLTYTEVLPIGLLMTLVASLVFKKKASSPAAV